MLFYVTCVFFHLQYLILPVCPECFYAYFTQEPAQTSGQGQIVQRCPI